jgi:hypothetical protein
MGKLKSRKSVRHLNSDIGSSRIQQCKIKHFCGMHKGMHKNKTHAHTAFNVAEQPILAHLEWSNPFWTRNVFVLVRPRIKMRLRPPPCLFGSGGKPSGLTHFHFPPPLASPRRLMPANRPAGFPRGHWFARVPLRFPRVAAQFPRGGRRDGLHGPEQGPASAPLI